MDYTHELAEKMGFKVNDNVWYMKEGVGIQNAVITGFVTIKAPEVVIAAVLDYSLSDTTILSEIYKTKEDCERAIIKKKTEYSIWKIGDSVYHDRTKYGMGVTYGKITDFCIVKDEVGAVISRDGAVSERVKLSEIKRFQEITSPETLSVFIWDFFVRKISDTTRRWAKEYAMEKAKKLGIELLDIPLT